MRPRPIAWSLAGVLLVLALAAPGTPRARAADEPPRGGTELPAAIRAAFRAHLLAKRAELHACHEETAARLGAPLVTHLVFHVRVSPDGATAVRIVDRTRPDRTFERCLLAALESPRFAPHASDAPRSVLYDQLFTSAGPELPTHPHTP